MPSQRGLLSDGRETNWKQRPLSLFPLWVATGHEVAGHFGPLCVGVCLVAFCCISPESQTAKSVEIYIGHRYVCPLSNKNTRSHLMIYKQHTRSVFTLPDLPTRDLCARTPISPQRFALGLQVPLLNLVVYI